MERTREKCCLLITEISIQTLRILSKPLIFLSSSSSHPLFSIITTSSLLLLLYAPNLLLPLLSSPVLISTFILLATLLHFGSPKPDTNSQTHPQPEISDLTCFHPDTGPQSEKGIPQLHQQMAAQPPDADPIRTEPAETETKSPLRPDTDGPHPQSSVGSLQLHWQMAVHPPDGDPICNEPAETGTKAVLGIDQRPAFYDSLVEWGRRGGPLEVIYEEYEGEDGMGGGDSPEYSRSPEYSGLGSRGLGYFGLSDSESEDDEQENHFFRWDEDGDGLIEIALEEDNLIEIDISAWR